jgi:hypothetical protein
MKTKNEEMTTIDLSTLETVQGGAWGPALFATGVGVGATVFGLGHSKGQQLRGQGQPSDSLKDLVDPKNPANLMYLNPVLGAGRVLYKAGEYVGRS